MPAAFVLSASEKAELLRNEIAFLESEVAEKEWSIALLERDNAEIEFMASVTERRGEGEAFLFVTNGDRIRRLDGEIAEARRRIRHCRSALERYRLGERAH